MLLDIFLQIDVLPLGSLLWHGDLQAREADWLLVLVCSYSAVPPHLYCVFHGINNRHTQGQPSRCLIPQVPALAHIM